MYCLDCGTPLQGAYCGQCGRPRRGPSTPRAVGAATAAQSGPVVADMPDARLSGAAGTALVTVPPATGDGRRCLVCGGWVPGAGRCPACGEMADVTDDVGRAAAQAGAKHVHAVDRGSRGSRGRALLADEAMLLKAILIPLALVGVVVALSGVAGFVLVAAVALLAVVPASIADGRGGDRLSWYLYGVLLFPVAVGHALMIPTLGEKPGAASGDRQLRALVGGAAALFITLCVGFVTSELAAAGSRSAGTDACYELADEGRYASSASERIALQRAAASCLRAR